ncbi:MAG: methylmalonyl Co-A mutase-associated GTPase MeaB [Bacteroidetes bacterium]|nr:MAG: methylmalonyl Co-A mutase-associated GTPase MeaB [Bacteroidota bacterium]
MKGDQLENWLNSRKKRKELYDPQKLFEGIRAGDRHALARGITLLESRRKEDAEAAAHLVRECLPFSGNSIRIGITGVPGVGKSTFIESFGLELIERKKKVAVLAIDPSSEKTGGSILGDKTRMEQLSLRKEAFIRPSPAGDSLGGVARKTRESIFLCEAAGFDAIIVETVGVGQSETSVHSMVDFFLLLMLSGAGDELQGIKRGIMEMADLLLVTKADGENEKTAEKARRTYQNALHLFPPNSNKWTAESMKVSAFRSEDMSAVWEKIDEFCKLTTENLSFSHNRKKQDLYWFRESLKEMILGHIYGMEGFQERMNELEAMLGAGQLSSFGAAEEMFKEFILKWRR